jgi:hypothetical protein
LRLPHITALGSLQSLVYYTAAPVFAQQMLLSLSFPPPPSEIQHAPIKDIGPSSLGKANGRVAVPHLFALVNLRGVDLVSRGASIPFYNNMLH